jgi:glycosyltransferase involved in cell wall biosynthesis
MPPVASIGIPTWNRRGFLRRAVESVLSQTYAHIQIVISDDASADDTWEYIQQLADPRIIKVRLPKNSGMVANFNSALGAGTGEFFLMLNDDDALQPTAIEKMVKAFQNPPNGIPSGDVGVVWCPFTNVDGDGRPLWTVRGGPPIESSVDLLEGLFNGTRGPIISGIMVRRNDSVTVGGYDPRARGLADSANWGKIALRHPYCVCVNEPLMLYTVHPGGMTTAGDIDFWQQAKQREIDDYIAILREQGDQQGARRLQRAGSHTMANSTVTVLMRSVGQPGWLRAWAAEFWRSRSFMLTPFVLKRFLKDGWKLLRLREKSDPPTC